MSGTPSLGATPVWRARAPAVWPWTPLWGWLGTTRAPLPAGAAAPPAHQAYAVYSGALSASHHKSLKSQP